MSERDDRAIPQKRFDAIMLVGFGFGVVVGAFASVVVHWSFLVPVGILIGFVGELVDGILRRRPDAE